jgi:hypothetical protein
MISTHCKSWLGILLVCGGLLPRVVCAADDEKLQFNRDIRPILSDNCFRCHGFDKNTREADLRLDVTEGAYAEREGGVKPIVPGKPEESELFRRITTSDQDERMPPADSHQSLTAAQIDLIKRWITEGAEYQSHWAFIKPVQSEVPGVQGSGFRVQNSIDAFVAAKLQKAGLSMSPEADKATLLRRVTLDLTGLPPTLEELDAFLADASPDAYEKVVDRLLASPRYGERMVLEWLDAARYADTNGYQGDRTRTMWPWRDAVIRSLNNNMPFDQFTIEQLAGDLLPNATPEQKLASGFNRNHPLNGEGGRIPEESRNDYVMDRVETVGTVWLGLTVGCCRCHDHKYDPIRQKEYFQFFAYFNNVNETGAVDYGGDFGNANPVMLFVPPENAETLAQRRADLSAAEAKLNAVLPQIDAAQAQWEKESLPTPGWVGVDVVSTKAKGSTTFTKQDDGSLLTGGAPSESDVHELVLRTDQVGITAIRLEGLRHDSLPKGGPGRASSGNFVLTGIEGEAVSVVDPNQKQPLQFKTALADYAQQGFPPADVVDDNPKTGWAVLDGPEQTNRVGIFVFANPLGFTGGTELHVRFHYESIYSRHSAGRFRLSITTDPQPGLTLVSSDLAAVLALPSDQRNDEQRKKLREFYRNNVWPGYGDFSLAITKARGALSDYENSLPHPMVMDELPQPRESWVLVRGLYTNHGDKVEPGVPAFLPALAADQPGNRLSLARWLVSAENPLTPRVMVNRYWQMFFGTGLVKTTEDFGVQGEAPSHPELLDWLAANFVSSGWNVKAMHRLMVTSAAYRQSSRSTPELIERDPANRLLARGPRHRLSAFAIRDQALAVSGLLVEKLGGAPVKPYMAPGVWEDASIGKIKYERDKGEGLYRRSLYTFWRRIAAPAMFFDASARSVCTVRLPRTNTPLQALILMNDVQYVEASRNLATRVIQKAGSTPEERLTMAFRLCTARAPSDAERQVLVEAYQNLLTRFQTDTDAATKLVSQGDSPRPADANLTELAAYTGACSLILNLDETITKE